MFCRVPVGVVHGAAVDPHPLTWDKKEKPKPSIDGCSSFSFLDLHWRSLSTAPQSHRGLVSIFFSTLTIVILVQADPEVGGAILQKVNVVLYEDALLRVHHAHHGAALISAHTEHRMTPNFRQQEDLLHNSPTVVPSGVPSFKQSTEAWAQLLLTELKE